MGKEVIKEKKNEDIENKKNTKEMSRSLEIWKRFV